jgi:hypothetical protein
LMRVRLVIVLLAAAVGVVSVGAYAAAGEPGEPHFQAELQGGSGLVYANPEERGGEMWSWSICDASGANCRPFGSGKEIHVGSPPAGVTFRLTTNEGTTLTPVWNGPLALVAGPSVVGAVEANSLVRPVPARWAGGWSGDIEDFTQLAACATSAGSECTSLTDWEYGGGGCGSGTVIDPIFAGWYLQVASQVFGPGVLFAEVGHSTPYGEGAWETGRQTSVTVVGKIARAKHRRTDMCGPGPLDPRVSPRAPIPVDSATISATGAAFVRCWADPCNAVLAARDGRAVRKKRLRQRYSHAEGTIRPRAVIEHGTLHYALSVDGEVLARRTIYVQASRGRGAASATVDTRGCRNDQLCGGRG